MWTCGSRTLRLAFLAAATGAANVDAIADTAWVATHSLSGSVQIQSWKTLRDRQVVKQDLDYSCGAASLATLLSGFYGLSVTEEALLKAMDKGDGRASFEDMQRALTQFGFKAQGFAASYEQLMQLRVPVIVYLKHRKDDHFSVLRGIDENGVWLADPSLGNRTYSREQFLQMWETRVAADDHSHLRGKFLGVLPSSKTVAGHRDFFVKKVVRQTAQAAQQLRTRPVP